MRGQVVILNQGMDSQRACAEKLTGAGFAVREAASPAEVLGNQAMREADAIVVTQHSGSAGEALELVRTFVNSCPTTRVIFVAKYGTEALAVEAFRAGVVDYIHASLDAEELVAAIGRVLAKTPRPGHSSSPNPQLAGLEWAKFESMLKHPLIGDSIVMRETKARLMRAAAASDTSVLITGETGTGKELAAQAIHHGSSRRGKPLVSLNCAAIPESLLESELFGHEKGAFTGAQWATAGVLERAEGGTLFLDEVAEMSLVAQAKVLRVIETKEVNRLGGKQTLHVNVRFVAATNQKLDDLVKEHRFRPDLYFRLKVVHVNLPPLRERKSDLPALIANYVQEFNRQFGRQVKGLSNKSFQRLLAYDWPGNIRELRNLLEAAFVNVLPENPAYLDLPLECPNRCVDSQPDDERQQLLQVLLSTKWNKSEAARQLRWSRMTLYRKMSKHQILDARAA